MAKVYTFIDPDPVSRLALERLFKAYKIETLCRFAEKPGVEDGLYVLLGECQRTEQEPATAALVLGKPVRAGILLDFFHKNQMDEKNIAPIHIAGRYLLYPDDGMLEDERTGRMIRLTEKEGRILETLAKNGEVVSRKSLLAAVWNYNEKLETHTLETHIYRLRQKMEDDPAKPQILLTDEAGYRLSLS